MIGNDASHVGMMEGCFFVPRSELLTWLRNDLNISISKVESCATGAVYLQVLDKLFPRTVPMTKVNWGLKFEYEFIKNYKIMQDVFTKCNIKKNIEIEKLVRGKYQDNLEFLQWLKCLYDRNGCGDSNYKPVTRRQLGTGIDWSRTLNEPFAWLKPSDTEAAGAELTAAHGAANAETEHRTGVARESLAAKPTNGKQTVAPGKGVVGRRKSSDKQRSLENNSQNLKAKISELESELKNMTEDYESAHAESVFYFNKLRQIEILCSTAGQDVSQLNVAQISSILYAEDDESPADQEKALDKDGTDSTQTAIKM